MNIMNRRMKKEIINYIMHYSKGLIEDSQSCPALCEAFDAGEVTSREIEELIDELREYLVDSIG